MTAIVQQQRPPAYPASRGKLPENLTSDTGSRLRAAQVFAAFTADLGLVVSRPRSVVLMRMTAVQSPASVPAVQILRLPQVCNITGLGRSVIYQLESQCRFPNRVRIGLRAVGWVESEVQQWLASRIEQHRAGVT